MFANNRRKAYMAAVLNALIIGFSFLFVKMALAEASPFDLLAYRFTASFAAVLPVMLVLKPKDLAALLPLALLYPGLFFAYQTVGLVYASSSEAGIIQAAVPIFTLLLAACFLKERASRHHYLFMLLSVAGVVTIVVMKGTKLGNGSSAAGLLFVLVSAVSLAGYSILARKLTKSYGVIEITFVMAFLGFLVFGGIAVVQHAVQGNWGSFFRPLASRPFLVSILYLGVLSSLVTSYLSNYALSQIEAYKISIFNQLATMVSIAAGVIVLHEPLLIYHVIGAVLIIAGVVGVCIPASTMKKPSPLSR
ncbi:DMT family transporter [Paenibacillus filicis]|uniref:DMT family transporter n=1 Tax=Paenibacillus gyeongsangnamensis TaxID=3388067 RepID=A0ABT4QC90_9BACL|nr:DMT family transporter [Paenibacillus filicis]MCZ8514438.1 DMT family transporter [Paenibacillus filicis]